jgi:hypothetical protein
VVIEFADWAFLEALVRADEKRLSTAAQLFSDKNGMLSSAGLRRALKGALSMDLSLETQFWQEHFGESGGALSAKELLAWKSELEGFLRRGRFMEAAREDGSEAVNSISGAAFARILVSRHDNVLPRFVRQNVHSLEAVYSDRISVEDYELFRKFIGSLPAISDALIMCAHRGRVTRREFDLASQIAAGVTLPSHVTSLLFHVFNDPTALGMLDLATMLKTVQKVSLSCFRFI